MDAERFELSNPRILNKPMADDVVAQKPALPQVVDRFKAMVKEREEEIGILNPNDDVSGLSTDEIVRLYEMVLSELTFNSKPIITDLTIIAGEQREHAESIADAICARILEAPVEQKLPSLYLLDSIVKNIGRVYARYFSVHLPEVFCEAYRQVHPNLHPAMRHLFGTWSAVFPSSVLRKIESQLQFSPSVNSQSSSLTALRTAESPRPTHGIHVNPKYLEARRQFEHADSSVRLPRETSSALKMHGQTPAIGYDEYDSGTSEVISSEVGVQRFNSMARADRSSFATEAGNLLPSSVAKTAQSSSSYGIGVTGRDEEVNYLRRNHGSDNTRRPWGNSAGYSYSNGVELQGPRALIDAYGNDQVEKKINQINHKPPKVERLDINGIDSKVATKTWKNSEEEEFDWEDMSPTLVDRSRANDLFSSSGPPPGNFRNKRGFGAHVAAPLETDFRRSDWPNQAQLALTNDSLVIPEDAIPSKDVFLSVSSGHGLITNISGIRNETSQILGSGYPQQPWKLQRNFPQTSQHNFNAKRSSMKRDISSSVGEQKPPLIGSFPKADPRLRGSSAVVPRISSSLDSLTPEVRAAAMPASTGAWPSVNIQISHPLPFQPTLPPEKQIRGQCDSMYATNAVLDQGLNKSFLPEQQLDGSGSNVLSKLPQFLNQQPGPIPLNRQSPAQFSHLPPHLLMSREVHQNLVPPAAFSTTSHLAVPQFNNSYTLPGNGASRSNVLPNPIHGVQSSMPMLNTPNTSLHFPGGALPPLPPGPPPTSSHMIPISHYPNPIAPNPPAGIALSGLVSSLMAQGLISLTKQAPAQDSVGLEFDLDLLKVRHESAITALYADLPRQCTTCGLRFKCQEEHSSHMDWHVTKNRMSKNRKQKPSRKWFVSVSMWLRGAEALGTDAVPGFLPPENIDESKDDEEMAVPADENQNVCALCGEPFDDFYSDETEEWMYRGAVYMNAPTGSAAGMDRSQLGPIVHAKCRSDSSAVSPEDLGKDEGVCISFASMIIL
ncbi:unnamed protein product [Ilex paraguariensis]|uniref:CID domain-containing protein n=1 Tax=Ilex paraguariensis TaxID=185542 RepID=A0ABC8RPF8_9AQUA